MKVQSKLIVGCVFVIGIGLGMLVAAGAVFYFHYRAAEVSVASPADYTDRVQQAIENDDQLMESVEKLLEVPEIRAVLTDPEITEAIDNKNYFKLLGNEKFRQAARHPAMRALTRQLMKDQLAAFLGRNSGSMSDDKKTRPADGGHPASTHPPADKEL